MQIRLPYACGINANSALTGMSRRYSSLEALQRYRISTIDRRLLPSTVSSLR